MSVADLRPVFIIALLLLISGLFNAAEISLLALGRRHAKRSATGRVGELVGKLLSRPGTTLGAILITITTANYSAEAIAANWVITGLGLPVWVAIVAMSVLVLVFAEMVPISYAAANPEQVARAVMAPVWLATTVLSVPARAIGFVAEVLAQLLGGGPAKEAPITEGEIRAIVDLQAETGGLEQEEKVMIHQIFEFGDKVAREVMVPRTDIVAIPDTATVKGAGRAATEHHISRLPVYHQGLDDITGLVHVKDVIPLLVRGESDIPVTQVMTEPLRVPETKKLSDLLTEFRRKRRTMAIVVDEYGGTAGLVTLEDLLEEVVGDIYDEYDVVRPTAQKVEGGAVIMDGRLSIDEASEVLGVELPRGDYDSVAGLLYAHLGVVPKPGDKVKLNGITLIVEELEGHRITRVKAMVEPHPEGETEGAQ